jgi:hypothetical protein
VVRSDISDGALVSLTYCPAFVPDSGSPVAQVTLVDRKAISNLPAELGAVGEPTLKI